MASQIRYAIDADYERYTPVTYEPEGEGEYIGESELGIGDRMVVKVVMDGDKIAEIQFLEAHETIGICDAAIAQIPAAIIEAQSTEVDGVSGATNTSNAIKDAVANAIAQAK